MSRVSLCCVVLCVCAAPAAAESLTIAQAVDEAIAHNLSLLAERTSLTIADAAMITARLRPNPVLSGSADHLDLLGTGFDEANNGGPPEIAWRVDLPIERGGKRDARIAVAAAAKSLAEAQLSDAVRVLRQDVTLACIDVMAAQAARALVTDNLRTFEDLARVNRARVTAGAIAPSESMRSEVALQQFRVTAVRAELDFVTASAKLATLLGRPPGDAVEIGDPLHAEAPLAPVDTASLETAAFDARPDLAVLRFTAARTIADLRLQEAMGQVDYTVGAEYRRQQGIAGRSNSLGFFVSTPLPVFNRNQGEIARATAEHTQASQQMAARRAEIAAEVRVASREYETLRSLVATIEHDVMGPAAKARDTSAYTYRAGAGTLFELLDAQRAFNDTMQSYVDVQAGLRRAVARLNAAVGEEVVR
jgi:cobalt-zinc-cadmium efflux system outer membrane protein